MISTKIALRYFVSAKSHAAVNVISGVSVASVAVATAAIVIVLSVFNGFTNLTRSHFASIDPDIMVVPPVGKVFADAEGIAETVRSVAGVVAAVPTLTERGLVMTGDGGQYGVVFKGVGDGYERIVDYDSITDYDIMVPEGAGLPEAVVSVGVASHLSLRAGEPVELMTLKRVGRLNPANPASGILSQDLSLRRIVSIGQMEFDADNMFIPLATARELLQYENNEASAVEVALAKGASARAVAKQIEQKLPGTIVLYGDKLHSEAYRMIAVEKWVTFTMLIFILIIAAFNIISTLSLMMIEKRDNMQTLRFLGASKAQTRRVFAIMGVMITMAGGIIGIIIGVALALAQQWGGFIKLAGDASNLTITEYPVSVEPTDILAVFALVAVLAVLSALCTRAFKSEQ